MDAADLVEAVAQFRGDLTISRAQGLGATALSQADYLLLETLFEAVQPHVRDDELIGGLLDFSYPVDAAAGNALTVDQTHRMLGQVLFGLHRRYPTLPLPQDMVVSTETPLHLEGHGRPTAHDDGFEGQPRAYRYRPAEKLFLDS